MPLHWHELDDVYPSKFTILTAPARLAATGDLWADIIAAKHDLRGLLEGGKRSRASALKGRRR